MPQRRWRHRKEREGLVSRFESGEISREQFEAEKKVLGKRQQAEIDAAVGKTNAELRGIGQKEKALVGAEEAARKAAQKRIADEVETEKAILDMKAIQARLGLKAAEAEARGPALGSGPAAPGMPGAPSLGTVDLGAGARLAEEVAKASMSAIGTFSGAGASLVGRAGERVAEKHLKVSERMADDIEDIRDATAGGRGLAWQ